MKKKHHYVWKHYLKPWSKAGQIWAKHKERIFRTNLENVAQRRFFYAVPRFGPVEQDFIRQYIRNTSHPSAHQTLLDDLFILQSIAIGTPEFRKTGLEDYHSMIESSMLELMEMLYDEDLSFAQRETEKNLFAYFLGLQYVRTPARLYALESTLRIMSNHETAPMEVQSMDMKAVAQGLSFIHANFVGNWLSTATFSLLSAPKQEVLITGDQPVINVHADPADLTIAPKKIELYFPLTPNTGLWASEQQKDYLLTSAESRNLNEKIIKASLEQIYSESEESLLSATHFA
tara:strand:+ start:65 stop:931 length:867 start_codon:yes stop_codon:yes gene_type:complete